MKDESGEFSASPRKLLKTKNITVHNLKLKAKSEKRKWGGEINVKS